MTRPPISTNALASLAVRRPGPLAALPLMVLLLLIPPMQIGFSYYASFSLLLLILVVVRWNAQLLRGAQTANLLLGLALVLMIPLATQVSFTFREDLLRTGREAVMFGILMCALVAFRTTAPRDPPVPLWFFGCLLGAILVLCIVQTYYLPRGVYIGVPEEWFSQETGTIPSELALRYIADALRPQATFAEPSYLAFIMLSFAIMIIPRTDDQRGAWWLMLMIVVIGLLSRSLAFLFSMAGVILVPLMLERRRNRTLLVVGTVVLSILALALTEAGNRVLLRLLDVTTGARGDISTLSRIVLPLQVLPSYFTTYPFGVPHSTVEQAIAPFMPSSLFAPNEILQNAVFNLIFLYGIGGIALLTLLVFLGKDLRSRLYILACAVFNGAFLAIDKVAIIVMTLAIYEGGKAVAASRAERSAPRPVVPSGRRAVPV